MIEGGVNVQQVMFVQTGAKLRPAVHNVGFDEKGRYLFTGGDDLFEPFAALMASYNIYPVNQIPAGRSPTVEGALEGMENYGAAEDTAAPGDGESPAADDHPAADAGDDDGGADGAADAASEGADGTQGGDVGSTGDQGAAVTPPAAETAPPAAETTPAAPAAPAVADDDDFF